MYSLVMLAALAAGPDGPGHGMCPVTPSNYGTGFWSNYDFLECCAPARYGWVNCWNKGYSSYPGVGCAPSSLYHPPACGCGPCGAGASAGKCGHGGWCGYGWPIGDQPAYYTSALGCPPHLTAPPYAYYTERNPCCRHGHFAFDTGLIGHSAGVGYSGFGGYGNFGFYGAVPMFHPPTTADLPPFPRPEYRQPGARPTGPVPMPPLPMGKISPDDPKKDDPKKDEPKTDKERMQTARSVPATVVLSLPARATVTVEGHALKATGRERTFRTPGLAPGQSFAYTVRATLPLSDGQEEVETREVTVVAGEITRVSFERLFARVESTAGQTVIGANR
jgi:uncharacterized protein (TIGR03000 family)